LNERLKKLTGDNKSFQVTASYLLDLAQRAAELFKSSKPELQQKLLDYLLSNLLLDDKKLAFSLNYPFSEFVEQKKKSRNESESFLWQGYEESNLGQGFWRPL
jgi:site-specific DNA recombinase